MLHLAQRGNDMKPKRKGPPPRYGIRYQRGILMDLEKRTGNAEYCAVCFGGMDGRRGKITCSTRCRMYLSRLKKNPPPAEVKKQPQSEALKKGSQMIKERRDKGLCISCGEQAGPNIKLLCFDQAVYRAKQNGTTPEREWHSAYCIPCEEKRNASRERNKSA